ncbi:COG4223 family protein [Nereida sp. MMG025]|uniref:COG4223 family protein n=1 Tax=Nereida sp. MMG025 TaxID=2909981 RepID=UPI001F3E4E65|nr:hypothetical protein [Nereida sp. MMG025]MCF6444654.1 hypothetical protein [Nereida sp. MMG025]
MADTGKSDKTDKNEDKDIVDGTVEEIVDASGDTADAHPDDTSNVQDDVQDAEEVIEATSDKEEPEAEPEVTAIVPTPEVIKETTVVRKGGFFSMVIGGLIAAGLGFVVGKGDLIPQENLPAFLQSEQADFAPILQAQTDRIDALQAIVEDVAVQARDAAAPLPELNETVASLQSELTSMNEDLSARIDAIGTAAVAPSDGASPDVSALRAMIEEQNAKITEMVAQAEAQMTATEQTVAEIEAEAIAEAKAAEARSALGRIQASIQTGDGFAGALNDLQAASDAQIPDALVAVADNGVPSVTQLAEDFPAYARSALAAARASDADGAEGTGGRLAAFIARQTGARSVEPREGTDPDAVLSRVEAAVRDGALTDALAEIESLPETARVELADWLALAQSRVDAVAATNALSDILNSN